MIKKKIIWDSFMSKKIFFIVALLLPLISHGQSSTAYQLSVDYFSISKKNTLFDESKSLSPFFNALKTLQAHPDSAQTVAIVQIGDSHIQADFQTNVTRQRFQQSFGSAGRGLVVPLRLTKTNEPLNYSIRSAESWTNIKCVPFAIPNIGIGGLSLFCTTEASTLTLSTHEKEDSEAWLFKHITAIYNKKSAQIRPVDPTLILSTDSTAPYADHWELTSAVKSIALGISGSRHKEITFYGFNLLNGKNGILYHSIGINGARYDNYASLDLFYEQLPLLTPSLIIVSLGTNEAYNKSLDAAVFYQTIDSTIRHIRQACPQASLLLTTPAEGWLRYRSKYRKPNAQIARISQTIVRYATENQIACWDLFSVTGGPGSAKKWRKYGLIAKDGIHFNAKGYAYIGELLFQAIYNSYLKNK